MGDAARSAKSPAPSDADVVAQARCGDHAAFRILVERYQGRAYRLALRVLRDEDEAQDAVQDAFVKAYRSLARFQGRAGFYTWLYRIVMNQCLDRKRRDRSGRQVEWNEEVDLEGARDPALDTPGPSGPYRELARSELRELVGSAIATLPDDARRTLELREIDGLSYQEIAEALGVPKGTVMSRLHYARRRVRAALQEAGVVDSIVEGAA
jgi:RNA polymerase sigma-70 factor (ECF subfamily)